MNIATWVGVVADDWGFWIRFRNKEQKEVNILATDPVCEMEVEPDEAPAKAEYEGETYYFCAPGCKKKFEENPEKYIW